MHLLRKSATCQPEWLPPPFLLPSVLGVQDIALLVHFGVHRQMKGCCDGSFIWVLTDVQENQWKPSLLFVFLLQHSIC